MMTDSMLRMTNMKEEMLKHLDAAITLEQTSLEMYKEFRDKATNEYAKFIFERMVAEEGKHIAYVKKLREVFSVQLKFSEENVTELNEIKPEEVTFLKEKSKKESVDYLNALVTIVEFEKRAYLFYKDLESSAEDETTKQIFETLSEFEKEHYEMFKTELETLQNNPYL